MCIHEKFMNMCFDLARKANGKTSPNPLVGSVITNQGLIISQGYHKRSGLAHAELDAINNAKSSLKGATLYCNLEPCSHLEKKTPPCAQRIIQEGITTVIISNLDPNPKVSGSGVALLRQAGIEVITGVLEEKGYLLNEVFFTHITKQRPFIHLKWAQTIDGKVATKSFHSKWITSELSRHYAHKERSLYDAIVIGSNTLMRDNPKLTIRINKTIESKLRVILSPKGQISFDKNLLTDEFKKNSIIITSQDNITQYPIKHLKCETQDGQFNFEKLMTLLYKNNIYSIYIEGGAKLINSFLKVNLFDRISIYTAPKILGSGISPTEELEFLKIDESIHLEDSVWTKLGQDMLLESKRNICLQDS